MYVRDWCKNEWAEFQHIWIRQCALHWNELGTTPHSVKVVDKTKIPKKESQFLVKIGPDLTKVATHFHSLKIYGFLCQSNFTWNQIWLSWKLQHCATLPIFFHFKPWPVSLCLRLSLQKQLQQLVIGLCCCHSF